MYKENVTVEAQFPDSLMIHVDDPSRGCCTHIAITPRDTHPLVSVVTVLTETPPAEATVPVGVILNFLNSDISAAEAERISRAQGTTAEKHVVYSYNALESLDLRIGDRVSCPTRYGPARGTVVTLNPVKLHERPKTIRAKR